MCGDFLCISLFWYADGVQKRPPQASLSMSMAACATIIVIAVSNQFQWVRLAFTFLLTVGVFEVYAVYATTYA
ncbi:hypothetical protein BJ170DRAFT_628038 [Xylariales sp. AK1849]|nr:hypothetical protein BJ170DRAFT_628038 [Xylariales sp. AK1849]